MEKKEGRKFEEFIEGSNTFNGFSFNGCYGMSRDTFFKLLNIYMETGENLLDDYSAYIYSTWEDVDSDEMESIESANRKTQSFHRLLTAGIINEKRYYAEISKVETFLNNGIAHDAYLIKNARRIASMHAKKSRKEVYKLYGYACLSCGATENMTIDHVIPISKGGINDISNYQPLCFSCNSKKGIKKTDYRKKMKKLPVQIMDGYERN